MNEHRSATALFTVTKAYDNASRMIYSKPNHRSR